MKINKKILKNLKQSSFQNTGLKYYLGLDLGISSVGWAVMAEDTKNKHYLHDFGVRLFDCSEDGKSGTSHNQKRREFRTHRRTIRRRVYRIEKIKKILDEINFLKESDFHKEFSKFKSTNKIIEKINGEFVTEEFYWNPFVVRNKGLSKKLEKWEIYAILIQFCKKRGYLDKSLAEEQEGEQKTKKQKKESQFQSAISKAEKLTKEEYVSRIILKEPMFRISEKTSKRGKEILIYCKNGKYLKDEQSKTNYRFLFARDAYKKELEEILNQQGNYYPQLKKIGEEIIKTIFYQRDFEHGPKCKDHYQNKCNPQACSKWKTFLETVGKCSFYPKETRGFKSSLIFSAFLFATEINKFLGYLSGLDEKSNLDIRFKKEFYQTLLKNFIVNDWRKKEIKNYIKETEIWKQRGDNAYFAAEMWKSDKHGMNLNKALFLKELKKIPFFKEKINKINFKENFVEQMENDWMQKLGEILNKNITRQRRKEAIVNLLKKNNINLKSEELKTLTELRSEVVTTANVSFKYMKDVIQTFWNGENISQVMAEKRKVAEKELDIYKKSWQDLNPNKVEKIFSKLIDWDLAKNPIVFRAINQTRKILQALHWKYGSFVNINIELAREMAKSFEERRKILNRNNKNANYNEKIKDELKNLGIKINWVNMQELKLWKDQLEKCLYCNNSIKQEDIGNGTRINIDHIIPFSQLADDSYENRVLTHVECNQKKGQQTPLQFLNMDETAKKRFLAQIWNLKSKNKITWKKYNYLKTKNADELDDFVSKNLNDTRWITKYILGYVRSQINHFKLPTKVLAVPGQVNSRLRRSWLAGSPWGMDQKVRDITPFHHAIDAMILVQMKKSFELELAIDLVKLKQQKEKISKGRENNLRYEREREKYKTFLKTIKLKWQNRYLNKDKDVKKYKTQESYHSIIEQFDNDNEDKLNQPLYIKDLLTQIETRIPVKLKIENCMECQLNKKVEKKPCLECSGNRKIPKFHQILNEEEWEKETKKLKNKEYINLKFPFISYMTNYKIKSTWSSSEQYGFGVSDLGQKKNTFYKIWKKDPELKNEWNKKIREDDHWKKWKKEFENNEGFILDDKTGKITLTNSYYGVMLPKEKKEKSKWIRMIDLQKILKNRKKIEKNNLFKNHINKKHLLIKGINVLYFDKKKNKNIIRTFRGKKGEKIYIHPNSLSYVGDLKNEKIFGNWFNHIDSLGNIISNFKLINIDLLGNK